MRILIVESDAGLGLQWQEHLARHGHQVLRTGNQAGAIELLRATEIAVVILNLVLRDGSAFAVADFASYRQPQARVIFVTDTGFFSDGSIFQLMQNAAAFLPSDVRLDDLLALVDYYAGAPTLRDELPATGTG